MKKNCNCGKELSQGKLLEWLEKWACCLDDAQYEKAKKELGEILKNE